MPDGHPPFQLDPDIAAFLALQQAAKLPDFSKVPVAEARRLAKALRLPWNRGGPQMAASEEGESDGMRYRLHRPVAGEAGGPAILYLHGGGWTLMDIDTHDRTCRSLAAASGFPVLAVDYPLAPEAPFPVAIDRLEALIARLGAPGAPALAALRLDPARLALAGDSAGATLAVALALRLRVRLAAPPLGLGLFYGAYDCDFARPSWLGFGDGRLPLSAARMRWFWENYIPDPAARRDPLASPLHADLRRLPPSFVAVADHDVLLDENLAFAEALRAAGNSVELAIYPGTIHGFAAAAGAVGAKVAEKALAEMGGFLAGRLRRSAQPG